MKKILFLSVILGMLICSTSAFALAVDPAYYTSSPSSVNSISPPIGPLNYYTFTWSLTNPGKSFTSATLDPSGSGNTFGSPLLLTTNITTGGYYQLFSANTLPFGSGASLSLNLVALNDHIIQHNGNASLQITSTALDSSANLSGVKFSGHTVAPEPISMALVGAGLVALPFARRFRNKLQKT